MTDLQTHNNPQKKNLSIKMPSTYYKMSKYAFGNL